MTLPFLMSPKKKASTLDLTKKTIILDITKNKPPLSTIPEKQLPLWISPENNYLNEYDP